MTSTLQVHADIEATFALMDDPYVPMFIPTRYPFTYGYDFVRQHPEHFGSTNAFLSRGEAARVVTAYCEATNQHRGDVITALADAMLRKEGITLVAEEKEAALTVARRESWRSMGLDGPQD